MNVTVSKTEMWWRGFIYVVLAVDGFLLSDVWFVAHIQPWARVTLGAVNAGMLVVRTFIDKSTSQGEPTEAVPVTTLPGDSVETTPADESAKDAT